MNEASMSFNTVIIRAMIHIIAFNLAIIMISEAWLAQQSWLVSWSSFFLSLGMEQLHFFGKCANNPNKAALSLLLQSTLIIPYILYSTIKARSLINIKLLVEKYNPKISQLSYLFVIGVIGSSLILYAYFFSLMNSCNAPHSARGILLHSALLNSDLSRAITSGLILWLALFFYLSAMHAARFIYNKYLC